MPRAPLARLVVAALALGTPLAATAQFESSQISGLGAPPLLLTKSSWTWESPASGVTVNVYRRQPGAGFECIASNLVANTWPGDPQSPTDAVWWYTVNGDDGWGENLHGNTVPISRRCPCSGPAPAPAGALRLETIYTPAPGDAERIASPVHLASPPGDTARLFVVEQAGRIAILKRGQKLPGRFLDIRPLVRSGGEQGLLSLSFHPSYATNGLFYLYYTAPNPAGNSTLTVAEYQVSAADPDVADPATARVVWTCPHTNAGNHNGGQAAFGPDGYLYIGPGDGGSGNDPWGNGQNLGACLGKIHRIDVDNRQPPLEYAIPATNPFVGVGGALPEIWAYGLRNPWRFSFDRQTGDLYIADVGQGAWEEVDVQPAASPGGENYGWKQYEGNMHCANGPCDPAGKTWPVTEYGHNQGLCSITGGHVYRGCRITDLAGTYFYIDYCGRSRATPAAPYMQSFDYAGGAATNPRDWSAIVPGVGNWSSFGEDARGEIYLLNVSSANIYRLASN